MLITHIIILGCGVLQPLLHYATLQGSNISCCSALQEAAVGAESELDSLLAMYPGLKGKTFAEWQGGKRLVCIHLGSAACMSLLPDTAFLFKLLNRALEAADAKAVLLTGNHLCLYM